MIFSRSMLPDAVQIGSKRRSHSPAVVIKKSSSSSGQAWPDEGHFPRHYDKAWKHAVPRVSEPDAIESFKMAQQLDASLRDGYAKDRKPLYIDVSDYEIYSIPEDNFFGELHSLDYMDLAGKKLLFSGVLSIGSIRHYVQNIPMKSYSIEGYGAEDEFNTTVYLNSPEASRDRGYDIWYKLRSPSRQYKCFHDAFQWVATLGKLIIDYLEAQQNVGLADFRQNFFAWLQQRFPNNLEFKNWREAYGSTDFRKAVHAHISYLWSEAVCLDGNLLKDHPLWDECGRSDDEMIEPKCDKVVATPHVYNCFKNRYFAGQLSSMQLSDDVQTARQRRIRNLGFPSDAPSSPTSSKTHRHVQHRNARYEIGDVVSIAPDEFENQLWRKGANNLAVIHEWIGYVHHVKATKEGGQRLYVMWLYRPEDTTILTTDYPITQELFMSDNCNCEQAELESADVIRRCSVEWFSKGNATTKDYLVRQKYDTKTESFVTITDADFRCTCRTLHPNLVPNTTYCQGETVYVGEKGRLEPVVVQEYDPVAKRVKIRSFVRLDNVHTEDDQFRGLRQRPFAANELAWTDNFRSVSRGEIQGRCEVRFFSRKDIESNRVPFPYNQGGAGHCWILSMRVNAANGHKLEALLTGPHLLRQGPDYMSSDSSKGLRGLSLFSGLGNLDRGLEAGGAAHFHTSVDMNGRAIQTLRANAENSEEMKLWFGSVDDYLHALLSGDSPHMNLVADIGDVGVIAAGSPCPGFSKLQQDWRSEQSLKNAAHVTTFASFVDVYRPEYGFLENVVNIGAQRKEAPEELVLSQLIGCLVSMGYQVQQFIMSAWNYGSPQHRNRTIVSITAPGRTPIMRPRPSHCDPVGFDKTRSVGKLLNGERFGVQELLPTPFTHITPGEVLGHLPDIGYGIKHPCIRYPDHVLRQRPNIKERRCIAHIPTYPPGVGLAYAVQHGLIPKYLYEGKSEINGKAYKRIRKDGLIGTIVTAPSPHDSRSGPFVHYEQNRCITLEEARIGQDIPPDLVLIGNVHDQFKMVGNAVDRRVSKALGLELRRALDRDHRRKTVTVRKRSVSVVINVKRQSASHVPRPTVEKDAYEEAATASPGAIVKQEAHRSNAYGKTNSDQETSSFPTPVTQGGFRQSTETSQDEEDQGPIVRGGRPFHRRLASGTTASGSSSHEAGIDAQLEAEFGFHPQVKPGGNVAAFEDDGIVEYDAPTPAPILAHSRNGFPGTLSKTLSAIPSLPRSSCPMSKSQTTQFPARMKRPRGQGVAEMNDSPQDAFSSSKRVKNSPSVSEDLPAGFKTRDSRAAPSRDDLSARKTRHSGLSVDFAPQSWGTTVEKDVRAKHKLSKRAQSRPYA
ncbi:hypothetical protein BU23DRAFT_568305 [Bimuria novae-zelandiae CBS 107.79]|uniref:DNA (cytosine-5-)-methyltransferase n=1 Tax=Bimuria novae-zelandiae CBS 107.79 TaxID=1447943 RepID=A0A6A5V791_9PLEO|nr:hypothetical protein BU23DRAFT_568305 [Bimuria novae-zelandiae CBS 107.79]